MILWRIWKVLAFPYALVVEKENPGVQPANEGCCACVVWAEKNQKSMHFMQLVG